MPPLTTISDSQFLSAWGYFAHHQKFKTSLIAVGRTAYQMLAASGRRPQPAECEKLFTTMLITSAEFAHVAQIINIPNDSFSYWMFAEPIARLLLDQEWQDISK